MLRRVAIVCLCLVGLPAWADETLDPMQVVADVTAIDATCHVNALFGAVFRYGEEHGVRTVDILPLGKRRAEFEADYQRRLKATPPEQICGFLRAQYDKAFPDWFTARTEP